VKKKVESGINYNLLKDFMFKYILFFIVIEYSYFCFAITDHELASKYAPVYYLHPQEGYYPTTVEDYFLNRKVRLVYNKNHKSSDYIIGGRDISFEGQTIYAGAEYCQDPKVECISMGKIYSLKIGGADLKKITKIKKDYFFILGDKNLYYGSKKLSEIPVYTVLKKTEEKKDILYEIQYLSFFAFNGAYKIGKIPFVNNLFLVGANAHESDLEHITIKVKLNKGTQQTTLEKVYYGSHGTKEGVWIAPKDVPFYPGTARPISYVALGGHGNYHKEGEYVRIFGYANDLAEKGKLWIPEIEMIYLKNDDNFDPLKMGWVYHKGALGPRGVSAPIDQGWFNSSVAGDLGGEGVHKYATHCPLPSQKKWLKLLKRFSPIARFSDCASRAAAKQILKGKSYLP
jgi:hypothetical protein